MTNWRALHILRTCADHFGLTVDDLKGRALHRHVVAARHIAMVLLRDACVGPEALSSAEIGMLLNRDHTSVLYALARTRAKRETKPAWARAFDELEAKLAQAEAAE